jgi:signal transduction histidine kinase
VGVAELDRAGDALNRTALRLGEIVARERAFTSDVSHQLNTPLTSLRLGLESAILGGDDDRALERAVDEVERLQTTVATLFAVARDAQAFEDARCDLAQVCTDVGDRVRAGLAAEGRRLHVEIDDGLPTVRCTPEALHEILAILVDNGRRHGAGTVTIAARPAGRGAVVEVSDEGGGILRPDIAFVRRAPDADGHGIGLALARSLAEAHEARLELTHAHPHPVFTLALPGSPS